MTMAEPQHVVTQVNYVEWPSTDAIWGAPIGPRKIYVHTAASCRSEPACPVHRPSDHHMSTWPRLWRADIGVLERTCLHGVGHPDPDQFHFWEAIGTTWRKRHGCDGCCEPPCVAAALTGGDEPGLGPVAIGS